MANLINSTAEFWTSNEDDSLSNGRDGSTEGKASRNVVYDTEGGQRLTTTAIDGDLRELTNDSYLTTPVDGNTSGNATKAYSPAFLMRWLVKLMQDLANGSMVRSTKVLQASTATVESTAVQVMASAPNASSAIQLAHLSVMNESGSPQSYTIRDGSSGNVLYTAYGSSSGEVMSLDLTNADYVLSTTTGSTFTIQSNNDLQYSYNLLYAEA